MKRCRFANAHLRARLAEEVHTRSGSFGVKRFREPWSLEREEYIPS